MSDLFLLRLDLVRVTRQRQQSLPLDVPAYLVTRRRMVMIMIAAMMMAMMIVLMIVKAMMIIIMLVFQSTWCTALTSSSTC